MLRPRFLSSTRTVACSDASALQCSLRSLHLPSSLASILILDPAWRIFVPTCSDSFACCFGLLIFVSMLLSLCDRTFLIPTYRCNCFATWRLLTQVCEPMAFCIWGPSTAHWLRNMLWRVWVCIALASVSLACFI